MRSTLQPLLAAFLCLFLAGCGALSNLLSTAAESDIYVRVGTAEYIGGDVETAERVIEFAADAQARLDGTVSVPLERLQAEADRLIPWHRMSPGQRIIAEEVLASVERRLRDAVVAGELPPDAVADLRAILATVERQARRELSIALA